MYYVLNSIGANTEFLGTSGGGIYTACTGEEGGARPDRGFSIGGSGAPFIHSQPQFSEQG